MTKPAFAWNRLRTRLIIALVGMVLLSGGALAAFSGIQFRDFVYAEAENNLATATLSLTTNLSETLENINEIQNNPAFQNFIDAQATQLESNIVILNPNGHSIVTSSNAVLDVTGNDVQAANNNQVGTDRRLNANNVETIYAAAPVIYENNRIATIQLFRTTEREQTQIQQQWTLLAVTVLSITLIALIVASWLSITLTRPLSQLQGTVAQYASGDLSERFTQAAPYEIHTLGENFNQMAGELQAMIDEQRLFASNASHELRTPLASMKIRTELLLSDELDAATQTQYLHEIDEEVIRMSGLIEDLFLLSRIDTDRLELGQEQVDIHRLVMSVYNNVQTRIEQKQITLTRDFAEQLPNLKANNNHIRTIIRNVVDNAIKYTPNGGNINWSLQQQNNHIHMIVRDSGIGITDDDLGKITKRFYRADLARSQETPGHGLGLSLVQSITDLYGGQLHIRSEGAGKGTQVAVQLPIT